MHDAEHMPQWMPWTEAWAQFRDRGIAAILSEATRLNLDPSALEKAALLHLPRFSYTKLAARGTIEGEVARLGSRMATLLDGFRHMTAFERVDTLHRSDVGVRELPDDLAKIIHEHFHYLGTPRNGKHFGMYHAAVREWPASMVTLSDIDVAHLAGRADAEGQIVSRMFAFPWAPFNSISSLLGAVARLSRGTLFTYVNPNLGFNGSSYKAANWILDGTKRVTYRYVDGNYITARNAYRLGSGYVTYSQFDLEPLQIWRHGG